MLVVLIPVRPAEKQGWKGDGMGWDGIDMGDMEMGAWRHGGLEAWMLGGMDASGSSANLAYLSAVFRQSRGCGKGLALMS